MKNILFEDLTLFKEGEQFFIEREYEKALEKFNQFSEKHPNGTTFVAGRKAICLMELSRFMQAEEYLKGILKASVMPFPAWEKHYNCLYAECLRSLGEIEQAESLCNKIIKKYPSQIEDPKRLLNKMNFYSHWEILRTYSDWNDKKECIQALIDIIDILSKEGDIEEAVQYALKLIDLKNNYSVAPYLILNS